MKNYHILLLFACTALCTAHAEEEEEEEPLCESRKVDGLGWITFDQVCFPDKTGYHICKHGGRSFSVVQCKPGLICRCYADFINSQECECVDPTPRPQFPKSGVIRWSGKELYDNEMRGLGYGADGKWKFKFGNLRVANLSGEVHMDRSGRFLLRETKVAQLGWKWRGEKNRTPATMTTLVVMVIPNADGSYTKYEKKDSNECKKTTVQKTEWNLRSIWKDKPPNGNEYYKFVGKTEAGDHVETQEWNMFVQGDGWDMSWTWFVDYDKQQHHAIPTKMIYNPTDEEYKRSELQYTYQTLGEGETSFNVVDYCS